MLTRLAVLAAFVLLPLTRAQAEHDAITWQQWSDSVFAQAKREGRFVLLDLGTVWCHWCHVMEETTYQDPSVIELINKRYIAVRVDADGRPDLSNRYEDYGWPATIVFNADGGEIVKRRGYLPPLPMASMLQAIIDDPTPGPSVVIETISREPGGDHTSALPRAAAERDRGRHRVPGGAVRRWLAQSAASRVA